MRAVQDEPDGDEVSVGLLDPLHEVRGPVESDRSESPRHSISGRVSRRRTRPDTDRSHGRLPAEIDLDRIPNFGRRADNRRGQFPDVRRRLGRRLRGRWLRA
jgi:hypothetical protein